MTSRLDCLARWTVGASIVRVIKLTVGRSVMDRALSVRHHGAAGARQTGGLL